MSDLCGVRRGAMAAPASSVSGVSRSSRSGSKGNWEAGAARIAGREGGASSPHGKKDDPVVPAEADASKRKRRGRRGSRAARSAAEDAGSSPRETAGIEDTEHVGSGRDGDALPSSAAGQLAESSLPMWRDLMSELKPLGSAVVDLA